MEKKQFKIGDTIRVIGYRPGKYAPGIMDEIGSEALFKSLVGRCYKIEKFDEYGYIELRPTDVDTVWIEPELVELVEDSSHAT